MNAKIHTLCEDARRELSKSIREASGTFAEELLDGANVIRVTLHKSEVQSVTAVFKDEFSNGSRKLIELILTRHSDSSDIQAVYKITE